jgi:hypothetical protein
MFRVGDLPPNGKKDEKNKNKRIHTGNALEVFEFKTIKYVRYWWNVLTVSSIAIRRQD